MNEVLLGSRSSAIDDRLKQQRVEGAVKSLAFRSAYDSWWIEEARDFARELAYHELFLRVHYDDPFVALVKEAGAWPKVVGEPEVTARLFDELPLIARRLVGDHGKVGSPTFERLLERARQTSEAAPGLLDEAATSAVLSSSEDRLDSAPPATLGTTRRSPPQR